VNKLCCVKDNLYWSDWEARSILQVDKLRATEDGYGVKNAVLHLYSPMDVQVYHELKQPPAESELLGVLYLPALHLVALFHGK